MREIKFKAKRLDNGEWCEGYFYEENGNTYIIENRQKESMLNRNITYHVDPKTVCQFTGLKDREGNEIWEGDLMEGTSNHETIFAKGAFLIRPFDDVCGKNIGLSIPLFYFQREDGMIECKVVGNKFDKK